MAFMSGWGPGGYMPKMEHSMEDMGGTIWKIYYLMVIIREHKI